MARRLRDAADTSRRLGMLTTGVGNAGSDSSKSPPSSRPVDPECGIDGAAILG